MRRLGAILTWAGVGVWAVGIVWWLQGVWVTLPPDTVKIIVLTLAALTGGALVAAGAATSRAGHTMRQREIERTSGDTQSALPTAPPTPVYTTRVKDPDAERTKPQES